MFNNFVEVIESQELLQKIENAGYGKTLELFLMNENKVYTKKGRLNKSGACRILKCKPKELDDLLKKLKEVISAQQFLD
jgi:hypothetical protein